MSSRRTLYFSILGIAFLTILILSSNPKRKQINRALNTVHSVFKKLDSLGGHNDVTSNSESNTSFSHTFPETNILNTISKLLLKKVIYYISTDHMQIVPLPEFNLNNIKIKNKSSLQSEVKCKNGYILELNKLKKLGDAYITKSDINTINFLQLVNLKSYTFVYDCFNSLDHKIANVHVTAAENQININISFKINLNNYKCLIDKIDLTMLSNGKMFYIKIDEVTGTKNFYENFLSWLNKYYQAKITTVLKRVFLPRITLSAYDVNMCSYFHNT